MPEMAALIDEVRAPFRGRASRGARQTESLLYRRGNFNGTFDDLICEALLRSATPTSRCRRASAGARASCRIRTITVEDLHNATAMTYPAAYRSEMTGEMLHQGHPRRRGRQPLQPDPYYQQGGDMVRVGGMGYRIDVNAADGLAHLRHDAL
jgi:sulfur-oxidizing protein SoxB